jgi:hypothetical protein
MHEIPEVRESFQQAIQIWLVDMTPCSCIVSGSYQFSVTYNSKDKIIGN